MQPIAQDETTRESVQQRRDDTSKIAESSRQNKGNKGDKGLVRTHDLRKPGSRVEEGVGSGTCIAEEQAFAWWGTSQGLGAASCADRRRPRIHAPPVRKTAML